MSRSKAKHKRERKRRHARQIINGERTPKVKDHKIPMKRIILKRRVKLSQIDPEVVKAVLIAVERIKL